MIGGRVAWRGAAEFRVPVGGVASVVWQLRYGSACDMNSVWPVVLATFAIFCSSRRTVQSRNITQTARLHGADIGSARPEGAATYQPRAEWTRPGEGTPPWVGMASPAKALTGCAGVRPCVRCSTGCAGVRSSRQGCDLAGALRRQRQQVLSCQLSGFGHVAMPVPVSGKGTGSARCIRPCGRKDPRVPWSEQSEGQASMGA